MLELLLQFKDFISQPWPWYVSGPMIAFIMFLLLFMGREFGISANFRVMCAADGADNLADFFKFDWGKQGWNLLVALGSVFGGYLAATYFSTDHLANVSAATVESLKGLNMNYEVGQVPLVPEFFSWEALFSFKGFLVIIVGGFLVGFGARYAGGCTSGHAISGMSALQIGSLYALIGFFIGGLLMTYLLFPLIF